MAQYISEKQALAARERSAYKPFMVEVAGLERTEEIIEKGHPLYSFLASISIIENVSGESIPYPVIPDACIYLIFYTEGEATRGRLCGANEKLRKINIPPGQKILIFNFIPGTCESFVKGSMKDMLNTTANVEDAISGGKRLASIAERDISTQWKAVLMSRVLRNESNEKDTDYLVRFCTEEIYRRNGMLKISDLAARSGFTERYLGKVFERYIGLSPKNYAEIIRFQNSLHMLFDPESDYSSLDIALECGYFDHAHMNRAYNRYLGHPSGSLRKDGFESLDYSAVDDLF